MKLFKNRTVLEIFCIAVSLLICFAITPHVNAVLSKKVTIVRFTHDLMMDEKNARKMIKEVDAARENYQKKYCPEVKSIFDHKDLMIDSSKFGIEGTAKLLSGIVFYSLYFCDDCFGSVYDSAD